MKLIEGVDKYHIVATTESDDKNQEELNNSFIQLCGIQDKLSAGESSRCPRCGEPFDARRGAVSRRVKQVMICDLCGRQEAIEDFLINGKQYGSDIDILVPADKNNTGFESVETVDDKIKLDVNVKPINDWYIVKIWQGKIEK